MKLLRARRYENGFSLVETLAALLVFAIITLGLIPLLAGSLRGSDISRKGTAGKQLVTEAMERVRGLPFYIDYNTQARKVDVLDLYYPSRTPVFSAGVCTGYLNVGSATCTSTNYAATGPSYVTTCPDTANIACPQDLPDGYSLTYEAAFVLPVTGATETYTKSTPATTYAYNSSGNDRGPRLLVEMVITGRWQSTGRGARTYQARTLLSDRRFSGLKILGEATIDYGVQFLAGYSPTSGFGDGELTATGGIANSRIEIRRTATASSSMTAAEIFLLDLDTVDDSDPDNDNIAGPSTGATSTAVAPPDSNLNPSQVGRQTVAYSPAGQHGEVAGMDISDGDSVSAAVPTTNLPSASADFDFSPSSTEDLWVTHRQDDVELRLDDSQEWVARVITKSSTTMTGSTSTTTNALGTQPGVATTATVSFKQLQIFYGDDSDDINDPDVDTRFDGALIAITGPRDVNGDPSGVFTATAACNADNDGTQNTNAASATYSGTLWYWHDEDNDDDVDDGSTTNRYEWVDLATGNSSEFGAGTNLSTTLENLQTGAPILVHDRNPDSKDVYLFQNGSNPYYLTDWSGNTGATTSITNAGRSTSARLEKALAIETVPLENWDDAADPSALAVAVGSVSCRAEDNR